MTDFQLDQYTFIEQLVDLGRNIDIDSTHYPFEINFNKIHYFIQSVVV